MFNDEKQMHSQRNNGHVNCGLDEEKSPKRIQL